MPHVVHRIKSLYWGDIILLDRLRNIVQRAIELLAQCTALESINAMPQGTVTDLFMFPLPGQ
jgi:hypothetical protein